MGVGVVSGGHSLASARFSRGTSGRVGAAGEPLRAVQDHRRATHTWRRNNGQEDERRALRGGSVEWTWLLEMRLMGREERGLEKRVYVS